MVSGCSGIINDRIYAITPSNNFYTLESTSLNGTALPNGTGCLPMPSFAYSACTVISNPPTIVTLGTDSHGVAGARLFQFSSSGSCQLSKWYSINGMGMPVSVVPSSCDSETSVPCLAVLGLSSSTGQYIIQYPTSLSFNGLNPIIVGPGNSDIHPVLALPPNDASNMYVIGYPTKDQIKVLLNGGTNSSTTTNNPSTATPALFSPTTAALSTPKLTVTTQSPNSNVAIFGRAEPTHGMNIVNAVAESYIKLEMPIENTGPATAVGNNIVIVSSSSLSVQLVSVSSPMDVLPVSNFNIPPSSEIQNANSMKGIDSLTPLPAQNGASSTVWINYDDGNGNHVTTSSEQPGLFTAPSPTTTSIPTDASSPSSSSLSTGAIVGIVIGSIVGGLLLGLLCFYLWRKQRRRQLQQHHQLGDGRGNSTHIALTDQRCLTEKMASTPTTYVSTPTSAIIIKPIDPVQHHHDDDDDDDDMIDDIPSLASLTRQINHHHHNDTYYEPTSTNETLLLDSIVYDLHNEPPTYASFPQGYATRSATRTINGQPSNECTIHYFPVSSANWVRHLLHTNAGLQAHDETTTTTAAAGLYTYDAITLSPPTQHGRYQSIWITSPFHLQHTLHSLLFEGGNSVVDCQQFSFKAWSTLSMLQSLHTLHENGWIHRKLNYISFFYDQASSVTDWRLTGFYQSIWYTGLIDKDMVNVEWDECSAPECINNLSRVSMPSMDIWSLGCILYSVATGKRAFQHMNDYQSLLLSGQLQFKLDTMMDEVALVDESFKHLLHRMLQINPGARDSLSNIITYWIQANQLDDDE